MQFPSGNDVFTTAFAPIFILSPKIIGTNILAPGPIYTLFPIVEKPSSDPPILTEQWILALVPILAFREIINVL